MKLKPRCIPCQVEVRFRDVESFDGITKTNLENSSGYTIKGDVEINLSANSIVKLSKNILLLFGYKEDDISIEFK